MLRSAWLEVQFPLYKNINNLTVSIQLISILSNWIKK